MKLEYEILESNQKENETWTLLRHKKTGLKISCHQCESDKSGFEFSFKTPVIDPYLGTSHVLEHCVLQGSRKYDVDFLLLKDFSVYSDFNGITEIDNTKYYYYSPIESECFKIIPILADYLFFPQLSEEAFMQENFRVEFSSDKDGRKNKICGVIYNEMKIHSADKCFIGGIHYRLHELTLRKIKEYHEKYYRPENCIFEYTGSAAVEEVLENLESLITELEENFLTKNTLPPVSTDISINQNDIPVPSRKNPRAIMKEYLSQFSLKEYQEKLTKLHEWQRKKDIKKAQQIMEPLAVYEYDIEIPSIDKRLIKLGTQRYSGISNKYPEFECKIYKSSCSIFFKASEPFTKENNAEQHLMFFLCFYLSKKMREKGLIYEICNNYDSYNFRFELTVNRTAKPERTLEELKSYLKIIDEYSFTSSDLILIKTFIFSLFFKPEFKNVFFNDEIFNVDEENLRTAASRFCKLQAKSM